VTKRLHNRGYLPLQIGHDFRFCKERFEVDEHCGTRGLVCPLGRGVLVFPVGTGLLGWNRTFHVVATSRLPGIVAALTSKTAITRVLGHLGLAADAPGFHPARPPPQTELLFADEAPDFAAAGESGRATRLPERSISADDAAGLEA
jgi:hypothetical protein